MDDTIQVKKRVTIYWLIPAKTQRASFRRVIRILAKRFNASRFEPHLTLCKAKPGCRVDHSFREVRPRPIRLRICGVAYSEKFTKTLFVRFSATSALNKLVADLGGPTKALRDPHVSLLYQRLPAATKRSLAAAIQLPFRTVTFDAIKVVNCVSPTETRHDVESWRVLGTKRLSR